MGHYKHSQVFRLQPPPALTSKKLNYKQTSKCCNLLCRHTTYRGKLLKLSKELNFHLHKIFTEAKKFHRGALLSARLPSFGGKLRARQSQQANANMEGAPLGTALMGTSPNHIWARTPNKSWLAAAKLCCELVFLIKILFLPQYLISHFCTGTAGDGLGVLACQCFWKFRRGRSYSTALRVLAHFV